MGILEMDFERILGVPFFIVVLTLSCCDGRRGYTYCMNIYAPYEPEKLYRLKNLFLNILSRDGQSVAKNLLFRPEFQLDLLKNFYSVYFSEVDEEGANEIF